MKLSALKIIPTAIILVAAASCAWPYFGTPEAAGAPGAGDPKAKAGSEVAPTLLNPILPPRPVRDPFEDREALRVAARELISKRIKSLIDSRQKVINEAKRKSLIASRRGAPGKAGTQASPQADPLDGLNLDATSVSGTRGAAVISGKTYLTGDALDPVLVNEPRVLREVHKGHVVIVHRGQRLTLAYASPNASGDSGKAGKRVTRSGKAGRTATGKGGSPPPGFDPFNP